MFTILILMSCVEKKDTEYNAEDKVKQDNDLSNINRDYPILSETYLTEWDEADNVDSPAIWHKNEKDGLIISTMKEADGLLVHDLNTGKEINRIGKEGNGKGEFDRPNGICVIDDYCFVVERNNKRVQVLSLPDFKSLGFFGSDFLINPYGISVRKMGNAYDVYITDNYETEDEGIPADTLLDKRVLNYYVEIDDIVNSKFLSYIGDTDEKGALRIVESIYVDSENNNLLIAEEDERNTHIKIYNLETGKFSGKNMGEGIFINQAEGIALIDCGKGKGFWVSTDQGKGGNAFHFFDRTSFEYIGTFRSEKTQNTDGIWLSQMKSEKFPNGVFVAVNNDGGVGVFDLKDIKDLLSIECE